MKCQLCGLNEGIIQEHNINPQNDTIIVCNLCSYYLRWARLSALADSLGIYFEPFQEWFENKTGMNLFTNRYNITLNVGGA